MAGLVLPGHDDRDVSADFVDPFFGQTVERRARPISLQVRRAKICRRTRTIFDYFRGNLSVTVKGSITPVTRAFRNQTDLFWNATGGADEA
jgi:hypothetical protein